MKFPADFLWGAATSAHQVEGHNHNQWSEWEKTHAADLAAHPRQSHFAPDKITVKNPANYISGAAADQYHRYEEDFDLMTELGLNAYRFGIEWSRVEPKPGQFDQAEIEHYRKVISALKKRGIEPIITLWHWTLPLWVYEAGGWSNHQTVQWFARYAERMAQEFGAQVKLWLTINEPLIYASASYLFGHWPPQQRNPITAMRVVRHLALGHGDAYAAIKQAAPKAQIGAVENISDFEAYHGQPLSRFAKQAAEFFGDYFLRRTQDYSDFIGLNFYWHNRLIHGLPRNANERVSDLGWELYPKSIYNVLVRLHKTYDLPIYVTENGIADAKDTYRGWFIEETVQALAKAVAEGVDLRGYMHWSLLDNFEWDKGFWPRFGLIEVDFATQQRTIRPSAQLYSRLIRESRTR